MSNHKPHRLGRLELHPESSLAKDLCRWRERGILTQQVDSLGALFDIGFARYEFVQAIHRCCPNAALELLRCRLLDRTDRWELTPAQTASIDRWLSENRLDVPWLREWATRAVVPVGDYLRWADVDTVSFDAIANDDGGVPEPDYRQVLQSLSGGYLFEEWQDDEPPPTPGQTWEAFRDRMKRAYQRRIDAIGSPLTTKRDLFDKLSKHAGWCARVHVGGRDQIEAILAEDPDRLDRDTVVKALRRFRALIELPEKLA